MNGVTAKIAKEIGMFFQNDNGHARSREQIASHDPRWSTTSDQHSVFARFSAMRFQSNTAQIRMKANMPDECTRSRCVYLQRGGRFLRRLATQLLGLFRTSDDRTGFSPERIASARCLLRDWSFCSASCGGSRTRRESHRS